MKPAATLIDEPSRSSVLEAQCFHCGQPNPLSADFHVVYAGRSRTTCCAGCEAVANTIINAGLGHYYAQRTTLPATLADTVPESLKRFDIAGVQEQFVAQSAELVETTLMIEGITCAACVWLVEQRLARLPGIQQAQVNFASHRALVRWDAKQLTLSHILEAVSAIGLSAHPSNQAADDARRAAAHKSAIWALFVAAFSMMQVMMYTVPLYFAEPGDISAEALALMRWASLILTVPVMLFSVRPLFRNAWHNLRTGQIGMDVPVSLAIALTFTTSAWSTWTGVGPIYFDSIAMFVFLLLGARFLEAQARARSLNRIAWLNRAVPTVAERITDRDTGQAVEVAVASLQKGDWLRIASGAVIPVDGVVVVGGSEVNEALLTGESRLVPKRPGDAVIGGTLNAGSPFLIEVAKIGAESVLATMVRASEAALNTRPQLAQFADRYAGHIAWLTLGLATLTVLAWWPVDHERALIYAIAVLVVTCPCALALATPAALTAATGTLARLGVMIRRGHSIETLAAVTDIVFDKTGTLTQGMMRVVHIGVAPALPAQDEVGIAHLSRVVSALETGSHHPIANALRSEMEKYAVPGKAYVADRLMHHPGLGISGVIDGAMWRLGSWEFVCEGNASKSAPIAEFGALPQANNRIKTEAEQRREAQEGLATQVWLAEGDKIQAYFLLHDGLRATPALMTILRTAGYALHVLSGDRFEAVQACAQQLGMTSVHAAQLPLQKQEMIRALQMQGKIVLVVGDGVNDAPALGQANISMAIASGADIARSSADTVLISAQLDAVAAALMTARRAVRIVKQNFAWAIAYNVVVVPLAMLGYITPWLAAIGMSTSSLMVLGNSLRLSRPAYPNPNLDQSKVIR